MCALVLHTLKVRKAIAASCLLTPFLAARLSVVIQMDY